MKRHTRQRQAQRGSVLLVAMIFLLVFAMMAGATFRGSLTSVQAIGNMQWRNEAITAANDAIDRLLSSAEFATNTAAVTTDVNKTPFGIDVTGDGNADIAVDLPVVTVDGVERAGPRCLYAYPIKTTDLDPEKSEDVGCFGSGSSTNSGLGVETSAGTGTGTVAQPPSLCSNTSWSIAVRARDAVTNTEVRVIQGVGVRVPTTAVQTCN